MATANPYAAALAQGLAPGQRSVVDPRAKLAEQLMGFKAAPVTTKGAAWAQALAAALSGGAGAYITGQMRDEQRQDRQADRASLEAASRQFEQQQAARQAETAAIMTGQPMPAMPARLGGAPPAAQDPRPPLATPDPMQGTPAPVAPIQRASLAAPMAPQGNVRDRNAAFAQERQQAMATLDGPALDQALADISARAAQAANGMPVGQGMRANPGVEGVFAGLPAPTGAVPVIPAADMGAGLAPSRAPDAAPMARPTADVDDLRRRAGLLMARGETAGAQALMSQAAAAEAARDRQTARQDDQQFRTQQADESRRAREEQARLAREDRASRDRQAEEERALRRDESRRSTETQRLQTVTQQEAPQLEAVSSASGVIANGERLLSLMDKGQVGIGRAAGVGSAVRGVFNESSERDQNRDALRRHVDQAVNAILSQAAGPQTEGDAQRARAQVLDNLDDEGKVRAGLRDLNGVMQRSREIATARIQGRRRELGLQPANLDPYMGVRSNADSARPDATSAAPGGGTLPRVSSVEEARRLPKGTRFLDPDGVERIVP